MSKVPGRYAATSEQWADAIRQEERERIIELLLKLRTCTPTKGLCENCQQTEFCIDQIREEQA
jgi:endonuclease III